MAPESAHNADSVGICLQCGEQPLSPRASACTSCGGARVTRIRADGPLDAGRQIGDRYVLLSPLGRGGFGTVYRATHTLLGTQVAVKILHVDAATHPDLMRRFYGEARNSARLSHPHNINVFDFGHTPDGVAYIAMDLIDGVPLSDLGLPLPAPRAVAILEQVAGAVGEAHGIGLVHRDLKPANIMVSQVDGRDFVRVLDYGIAKLVDSSTNLTQLGGFIGSPDYSAPEQLGATGEVDYRTDIYALGCMLYEITTGAVPFKADDPLHVLYMHRHEAPPPPSQRAPMSPQCEALILHCMAKAPADRPASMAALRSELIGLPEYAAAGLRTGPVPAVTGPTPARVAATPSRATAAPAASTPRAASHDPTTMLDVSDLEPLQPRRAAGGRVAVGVGVALAALVALAAFAFVSRGDGAAQVEAPASDEAGAAPSDDNVAEPTPPAEAPPPAQAEAPDGRYFANAVLVGSSVMHRAVDAAWAEAARVGQQMPVRAAAPAEPEPSTPAQVPREGSSARPTASQPPAHARPAPTNDSSSVTTARDPMQPTRERSHRDPMELLEGVELPDRRDPRDVLRERAQDGRLEAGPVYDLLD